MPSYNYSSSNTIAVISADVSVGERLFSEAGKNSGSPYTLHLFNGYKSVLHSEPLFNPSVVLLDIVQPEFHPVLMVQELKQRWPGSAIILLYEQQSMASLLNTLLGGALGCIERHASFAEIHHTFGVLKNGGSPIPPPIAKALLLQLHPTPNLTFNLSARELEVILGIVDGLSYKMIAARLHISIDTVRKYIRSTYRKLNINSKGELLARYHKYINNRHHTSILEQ